MKDTKHSLLLACIALLVPIAVQASPTTWEIKGHLTTITGTFAGSGMNIGDPFRILVSFDTAEPIVRQQAGSGGGTRYVYAAESMTYRIEAGTICTAATPCVPASDPDASNILLRDDFANPSPPEDGYTFSLVTTDGNFINLLMRGSVVDIVNGPGLAALPDPRLATLTTDVLQMCPLAGNSCDDSEIGGTIESVSTPTYGAEYTLTARDCYFIDTTTTSADPLPRDCIYVALDGTPRNGRGRQIEFGGGLGGGEFARTASFDSDTTNPVTGTALGTVFGAVSFSGPSGLPVLKASAVPTDVARDNSNLLAYQRYTYSGAATPLPLVVDLGYGIADYSNDPAARPDQIGLRPGGAEISATLAIVDGAIPMPALAGNINTLACGTESTLLLPDGVTAWPAGSILGSASFTSTAGENNAAAIAKLDVRSCANPGQPVQLAANQSFIVATSIQTPARGKWSTGAQAPANGYVDASHTMRVTFDPNAPPALVQQLADGIAPQCSDCFVPERIDVTVDVRPGSADCINRKANGVVPVAILGSSSFRVKDVRIDASLKLGSLALRTRNGAQCSTSDINADGYPDLVCNFDNVPANWSVGQTSATVSGKLYNGLPFQGSDTVCVK